ncbi:MAG: permease-like cell division protein FtsX [Bacteroidales bacterium]|nr:permease-like cell division protein FtsX [Bacteroidales bacterium]
MSKLNVSHRKFFGARLTTIISISLMLFVLGMIAFMGVLAKEVSVYLRENIGFTLVLDDNIKPEDLSRLQTRIKKLEFAKSVQYISKVDALKELTSELGENPEEFLGFNPLQASLDVKLNSKYANNDSIAKIETQVRSFSRDISEFNYRKDIVQLVNDNMKRAGVILFALALILLAISFTLINNTVRLSVYSKRFIINTMQLVGATSGFIRRPFIWSNIVNGIIASIIAIGLLTGLIYYIVNEFVGVRELITPVLLTTVFSIIVALGIIITAIASFFAINKYLRMKGDDMYLV